MGLILGLTKLAYKSKCKEVQCCCIKIIRDIESEIEIDEMQSTSRDNNSNNQNITNL